MPASLEALPCCRQGQTGVERSGLVPRQTSKAREAGVGLLEQCCAVWFSPCCDVLTCALQALTAVPAERPMSL